MADEEGERRRERRKRGRRIGRLSPWSGRKGRKREGRGEINKKKEKKRKRETRARREEKRRNEQRGAEKTKRNCGLAAVDDLGGEGRGSRPGSGMSGPLLLLFSNILFSLAASPSLPRKRFSLSPSLGFSITLSLCVSLPFRPRWNRRRAKRRRREEEDEEGEKEEERMIRDKDNR